MSSEKALHIVRSICRFGGAAVAAVVALWGWRFVWMAISISRSTTTAEMCPEPCGLSDDEIVAARVVLEEAGVLDAANALYWPIIQFEWLVSLLVIGTFLAVARFGRASRYNLAVPIGLFLAQVAVLSVRFGGLVSFLTAVTD